LDHDNVRLLTALAEVCTDWFLDCYNNEDPQTLWEQVNRYTPFALHLARLAEDRAADLTARAALAEFFKYRGFVASGRAAKLACTARRHAWIQPTTMCTSFWRRSSPEEGILPPLDRSGSQTLE
jgi:hypothetical protein